MRQPSLRAQDIIVLLRMRQCFTGWTYAELGADLAMSPSQVHASVKRSKEAGLLLEASIGQGGLLVTQPRAAALVGLIVEAAPRIFYPVRGPRALGWPTAAGHPSVAAQLGSATDAAALVPVWPDADGPVLGEALIPLHRSALTIARRAAAEPTSDGAMTALYRQLACVDALRVGRARERAAARKWLMEALADTPPLRDGPHSAQAGAA